MYFRVQLWNQFINLFKSNNQMDSQRILICPGSCFYLFPIFIVSMRSGIETLFLLIWTIALTARACGDFSDMDNSLWRETKEVEGGRRKEKGGSRSQPCLRALCMPNLILRFEFCFFLISNYTFSFSYFISLLILYNSNLAYLI